MAKSNRQSFPLDSNPFGTLALDDEPGYGSAFSAATNPNRASLNQISDAQDPPSALQRRFTTTASVNNGSLGPIGSPSRGVTQDQSNGHPILDTIKQNLVAAKQQELASIESQKREFMLKMAALDERAQNHQKEMRALGVDTIPGIYNAGNQSEPTTPPAADSHLKGGVRSNRFSGSHISNFSAQSRRMRSESKGLTSPPPTSIGLYKGVSQTRPGSEVIDSNYPFSPPGVSRTGNTNRYSLPVSAIKSSNQDIVDVTSTLGLGPTNSASFLTEDTDEESSNERSRTVKARSYVHAHAGDGSFPILTSGRDGSLSASTAVLDKDKASSGINSKPTSARHSQVLAHDMKSPRKSMIGSQIQNLASPTKQRGVSDSSNESGQTSANFQATPASTTAEVSPAKPNGQGYSYAVNPSANQAQAGSAVQGQHPLAVHSNLGLNANLLNQLYMHQNQAGQQYSAANSMLSAYQQMANQTNLYSPNTHIPMITSSQNMTMPGASNGYRSNANAGLTNGAANSGYPTWSNSIGANSMTPGQFTGGYALQGNQFGSMAMNQRGMNGRAQRRNVREPVQPSLDHEFIMSLEVTPLNDIKSEIPRVARDQNGCRFLQRKLDERMSDSLNLIFDAIQNRIVDLMMDPFGNYLCQKILDYCSEIQRTTLISNASQALVSIAHNQHGTRALQKMIETVTTAQQIRMIQGALGSNVSVLIQDLNGNHVIQKCLNKFSSADSQFIFDAVARDAVTIGSHRHGCCVLQRCVDHADTRQKAMLVGCIINGAQTLVQDPFGNYVLQYVLDMGSVSWNHDLTEVLRGEFLQFSRGKFASNVIEKLLKDAAPADRTTIIEELMRDPTEFQDLLRDQFGNYVVQTALDVAGEDTLAVLIEFIRPHVSSLRNTPHGRRIAAKAIQIEPTLDDGSGRNTPITSFMGGAYSKTDTTLLRGTNALGRIQAARFQSNPSSTLGFAPGNSYTDGNWRRHY